MSTGCNIIVRDGFGSELIFYRHCDGYPEGTLPLLEKFVGWVREKRLRNNVQQSSGWLIVLGQSEYNREREPGEAGSAFGWEVGAIEPTDGIHGDIAYLYVIDLKTCEIHINGGDHEYEYKGKYIDPVEVAR